jgi:hypothetical protein
LQSQVGPNDFHDDDDDKDDHDDDDDERMMWQGCVVLIFVGFVSAQWPEGQDPNDIQHVS